MRTSRTQAREPTQTLTITTSWTEQATELLDAIEQSIAGFPDDMVTNLEALVADARHAVADNSPTRGRRALSAIASFLTDTASGALGGMLGAQALSLVALMAT